MLIGDILQQWYGLGSV